MGATKPAADLATHAIASWQEFISRTKAQSILEEAQPVPSVIALRFRSVPTLGIGFNDYLEPGDQAHWGNLKDGRRVVVIRRKKPLDRGQLVHLELIQGRPIIRMLPEGDAVGFDHLGLQIRRDVDLVQLETALSRLDDVEAFVGGERPFARLKIVYYEPSTQHRYEFKLTKHRLWDVCLAEMTYAE